MVKLKPPHIIIFSFLGAIVVGTILLSLPLATYKGDNVSLMDRLFTAASATCVTGLTVKETASWAPFGRFVIMLLFQVGGLGIMTFSVLFAILLGRKITIKENLIVKGTLGYGGIRNLKTLILYIVLIVLIAEIIGAGMLYLRWNAIEDWPITTTIYNSIFHSISAFCNAGFSLFRHSFRNFSGDIYINIIMISLIFIGGIGFVVILDLWRFIRYLAPKRRYGYKISVQTKMAISISLILIVLGALLIFLFEKGNVLRGLNIENKILGSLFQAITARTAGFSTLPIEKFAPATLVLLIALMFVGASPGSTGGGIKTCTIGIVMASAIAMIKNKERVWMFGKTMPKTVIRRALVIFILGLGWVFISSLILSITERNHIFGEDYYLRILFETVSAFGTVGLSTGITPFFSDIGKLFLIITMFIGRIGPLTLALAIALQEEKLLYNYPEEEVMVG